VNADAYSLKPLHAYSSQPAVLKTAQVESENFLYNYLAVNNKQ
jgi:hypothetical protein